MSSYRQYMAKEDTMPWTRKRLGLLFTFLIPFLLLMGCGGTALVTEPVIDEKNETLTDTVVIVDTFRESTLQYGACLVPYSKFTVAIRIGSVSGQTGSTKVTIIPRAASTGNDVLITLEILEYGETSPTTETYTLTEGESISRRFLLYFSEDPYRTPEINFLTYLRRENTESGPQFCFDLHPQNKNVTLVLEEG